MINLQLADNEFFEEYKYLDKLCSDMYSCQHGISEYISQMEHKAHQGKYRIPSWNSDYKMLKHVRWVRNQIAHDSGAYPISEPEDLAFVRNFHSRILSGQDSLTLLRKSIDAESDRQRQQKKQQPNPVSTPDIPRPYTPQKKSSRSWIGVLIGIGILALILIRFYMSYFYMSH